VTDKRRKFGRWSYIRFRGYGSKRDAKKRAKEFRVIEKVRARVVPEKSTRRGGVTRYAVYVLRR